MTDAARHWIGGEWVAQGPVTETREVATGRTHAAYHDGTPATAEAAIAAAREAFERSPWAHAPRMRAAALLELADAIEARVDEIARAIAIENGKAIHHCVGETRAAVSEARYYAGLARAIFGRVFEPIEGAQSIIAREPAGVAAIIVPWNAPSTLLLRSLGPAMAAGCAAIVKGAHQTSSVNRIYAECLSQCPSLPAGIVNVVHGEIDVARVLTTHVDVDVVSFTGSSATGKAIMAAAAPTLKRLSLELGGKAPTLVFADADFDRAAREIAAGIIPHAGQMCTAIARVLVERSAWDGFVPKLAEAMRAVSVGDPLDPKVAMGPLFDAASGERYARDCAEAAEVGETVLAGEVRAGQPLANVATPALYRVEEPGHRLLTDELFAPIGLLEVFDDEDAAVVSANATRYGLASSVFTRDGARGRRVARAMKAGTVWLNCHNRLFAEAETGGTRESGLGRLHGWDGLADFQETKHVYEEFGRARTMAGDD